MTKVKTVKTAKAPSVTDEELKIAKANMRAQRQQGGKFLSFAFATVQDTREHIDNPGLAIGVALELRRAVMNAKRRAELQAEGDAIYAQMRGRRRTGSHEILVQVDPAKAADLAMPLIRAGLRGPVTKAGGWAEFRGAVEAAEIVSILEEARHRVITLEPFVAKGEPASTAEQAGATEPTPYSAEVDTTQSPSKAQSGSIEPHVVAELPKATEEAAALAPVEVRETAQEPSGQTFPARETRTQGGPTMREATSPRPPVPGRLAPMLNRLQGETSLPRPMPVLLGRGAEPQKPDMGSASRSPSVADKLERAVD